MLTRLRCIFPLIFEPAAAATLRHRRPAIGVRVLFGIRGAPYQPTAKGGLISEFFSLWLQSLKKVPNHFSEHYPPKEKMLRGVICYPFLEIGAKVKNFLRWSNLYTGSPSKLRFALLCCVLLITQEKRVVTTWTKSFKSNNYNLTNIVFLRINKYIVHCFIVLQTLISKKHIQIQKMMSPHRGIRRT